MGELKPCPFCGGEAIGITYIRDGWRATCGCGAAAKSCFHGPADMPSAEQRAVTAWNTRSPVTDEMVERAAKALEPFAKAAMGIKAFDPDFPLDGAALRASFDWYDKCQGEALKRHSVRLQDINFAAETHAAITAALGGPHG